MRRNAESALFGSAPTETNAHVGDEAPVARRAISVDRFELQGVLGRGGMGEVFAAYDPELKRDVAVKLLRNLPGESPERREVRRERLRREAAAIARLNHPNIVQVYDVGVSDGHVFLVMELVAGRCLRRWLAYRPRTPEQILDVFLQAGRGLAAAHSAGLVHRDFKLSNVLVGVDGRVRVIDFGLARRVRSVNGPAAVSGAVDPSSAAEAAVSEVEDDGEADPAVNLQTLTKVGKAMGTPAYMAPEQRRGSPATAASDQYAFCLSLVEALTGVPPRRGFPGAAPSSGVSPKLRAILDEGLSMDPSERWESMQHLLDALQRLPSPRRRLWRWAGIAGAGVGLLGTAAAAWNWWPNEQVEFNLPSAGDIWTAHRRNQVSEAGAGQGGLWVADRLDRYVDAFEKSRRSLRMVAAPSSGERTCIDKRRLALKFTVEALATPGSPLLPHAPDLLSTLPSQPCVGNTRKEAGYARELELPIIELRSRIAASDPTDLRADASTLHQHAVEGGSQEQALEAALLVGASEQARGQFDTAATHYELAYLEAHGSGLDRIAADAAVAMTTLATKWSRDEDESVLWAERACSELGRAGVRDSGECERARARALATSDIAAATSTLQRLIAGTSKFDLSEAPEGARIQLELARLHVRRGDPELAMKALRAAENLVARSLGTEHIRYAEVLMVRADIHDFQGRYRSAMEDLGRGLGVVRVRLGEGHPSEAGFLERQSRIVARRGDFAEAIALVRKVLALKLRSMDESHVEVAKTYYNLGMLLWAQGDDDEVGVALSKAKDIYDRTYGPVHLEVAPLLELLGHRASRNGEPEEALRRYDEALDIRRSAQGSQHVAVAVVLDHRFEPLLALGRSSEARQTVSDALSLLERELGRSHPRLFPPLVHLGRFYAEQGRPAQAIEPLDRALAIGLGAWGVDSLNLREAWVIRAEASLAAGRAAEAEADARRVLSLDEPDTAFQIRAHEVLGRALRKTGRKDEAKEHLRLAAQLRPTSPRG